MKLKLMTTVSVIALAIALPAYASDTKDNSVLNNVKSGLDKADHKMRDTADDIKAFFMSKNVEHKIEPALIRRSMTAHGLVGQDIVNTEGKKIADVKDIIVNEKGHAILVVVSDGGVLGIGDKVAAFDYNKVVAQKPDGTVVMTLSQDMIDRAAEFSYDQRDWAKAKVIPSGSISANHLLEGELLDNNGKKLADIENVYFRNADASQLIVSFNKKLGMGGHLASLDYDDVTMIVKDKSLDFQMTSAQSVRFENFTKSVLN